MLTLLTEVKRIYIFVWKNKRVAMRPVPPLSNTTKEKAAKLVSLCKQVDRNSSTSSFEEGGMM